MTTAREPIYAGYRYPVEITSYGACVADAAHPALLHGGIASCGPAPDALAHRVRWFSCATPRAASQAHRLRALRNQILPLSLRHRPPSHGVFEVKAFYFSIVLSLCCLDPEREPVFAMRSR